MLPCPKYLGPDDASPFRRYGFRARVRTGAEPLNMIFGAFLALIALVVAVVAIAQLTNLRARIEHLEMLLLSRAQLPKESAAPLRVSPPPLPRVAAPPPVSVRPSDPTVPMPKRVPGVNWESFVGIRLFAWIGGFALFLGIVFFVKYAFENNLVTQRMRVTSGGLAAVVLVVIGTLPSLRRYRIPAQTLIATGLLIGYADTYAAYGFYSLISLTAASVLMWMITAIGLGLAVRTESPWIFWLGVIGGFLTPWLFRTGYGNAVALFGYIVVLNFGITAVSVAKRWTYFIVVAAACTFITEFSWAFGSFGKIHSNAQIAFLLFQALFLLISIALWRAKRLDHWTVAAAAVTGFAPLLFSIAEPANNLSAWDFGFLTLFLGAAGLIGVCRLNRDHSTAAGSTSLIIAITLGLTIIAEWCWWQSVYASSALNHPPMTVRPSLVAIWHIAIFLLFALIPYICDVNRTWSWTVAAISAPPQFCFVYYYLTVVRVASTPVVPYQWKWLLPIGFALPAAAGCLYLTRQRGVDTASGDPRLASQGAALVTFISLIFPVQFHREWITLGWALEGLGLILLFHRLPNRRLRAAALIVFFAAFIRLALNPAVFTYHPRTHTPIFNWYLYAYGIAGLSLFAGAYWFGSPRERLYEKQGPPLLYAFSGILFFLLLNIEIADYFSIGPTLTFSFAGNFARDLTYTVSWSVLGFLMLIFGMLKQIPPVRFAAMGLLCLALGKLFLHDLDNLSQLYRIGAFISVAIIAIVASFAYQRFLSPAADK